MIKKVAVLGLGKIGTLVATLLVQAKFDVTGIDSSSVKFSFKTIKGDLSNKKFLEATLKKFDAVVSALPYHLNKNVVQIAHANAVHYFDLTEDVPTSDFIKKLSKTSRSVLAPQCGLAPGFIAIAGSSLAGDFEKLRSIELRVGALPQSPVGYLGYAFNWSPEGVVNEYLNDCYVISDGELKTVPAMQDLEKIVIDGKVFEAFTTSGGLGTACETYKGKVDNLNYKTIRYPGHMKLMRFYFHELMLKDNKKQAGEILVNAFPPVNDDVVYVHASAEGWKKINGKRQLVKQEFVRSYYPKKIDGNEWRAISWTTAASVCAVVEMVSKAKLPQKGFIKQEEIPLKEFLKTQNGALYGA